VPRHVRAYIAFSSLLLRAILHPYPVRGPSFFENAGCDRFCSPSTSLLLFLSKPRLFHPCRQSIAPFLATSFPWGPDPLFPTRWPARIPEPRPASVRSPNPNLFGVKCNCPRRFDDVFFPFSFRVPSNVIRLPSVFRRSYSPFRLCGKEVVETLFYDRQVLPYSLGLSRWRVQLRFSPGQSWSRSTSFYPLSHRILRVCAWQVPP